MGRQEANTKNTIAARVINLDEPNDFIKRTRLNEAGQFSSGSGSNASTSISIGSESASFTRPEGTKSAKNRVKGKGKGKAKAKGNVDGDEILERISEIEKSRNESRKSTYQNLASHDVEMMKLQIYLTKMKIRKHRSAQLFKLLNKAQRTPEEDQHYRLLLRQEELDSRDSTNDGF